MKDFKEAILEATRNNARPYTKEQAAAYAEIFEHVIAAFAENNALSYEEAYNQIAPSFSDNTGTSPINTATTGFSFFSNPPTTAHPIASTSSALTP